MRWIAIVPMSLYLLVATAVGLQLVRLARRTRQLPELALGLGLTCVALLGQPVAALGRVPALIGTPIGDALFSGGLVIALFGIWLLFLFTCSVFRPRARWAHALVGVAAIGLAGAAAGLISVGIGETDMRAAFAKTRPYAVAIVAMVAVCFLWNGIESPRYAHMLRRRLALGLADPVLLDRFQLWGVVGVSTTLMCAVLGGCMVAGLPPLTEPVPLSITASMSTVASVAWYLSFLPPRRYLDSVRRRGLSLA